MNPERSRRIQFRVGHSNGADGGFLNVVTIQRDTSMNNEQRTRPSPLFPPN